LPLAAEEILGAIATMSVVGLVVGIAAISVLPAVAYDDPPEGTIKCGDKVKISSSVRCNGGPAVVIGGCNIGKNSDPKGAQRQTICTKTK
jgi:hypothetical protein